MESENMPDNVASEQITPICHNETKGELINFDELKKLFPIAGEWLSSISRYGNPDATTLIYKFTSWVDLYFYTSDVEYKTSLNKKYCNLVYIERKPKPGEYNRTFGSLYSGSYSDDTFKQFTNEILKKELKNVSIKRNNNPNNEYKSELKKCIGDKTRIYMIERYLTLYDYKDGIEKHYRLTPKQKEILENIDSYDKISVRKSRQMGITRAILAKYACDAVLNDNFENNRLIISMNRDMSEHNEELYLGFVNTLEEKIGKNKTANSKKVKFLTDIKAHDSKEISNYGEILFDEFDYFKFMKFDEYSWLNRDKKLIGISTKAPKSGYFNKDNSLYGFKNFSVYWWQDPRFNKRLSWSKKESNGETKNYTCETDIDGNVKYIPDLWDFLYSNGYRPFSMWYYGICNLYNNDSEKIKTEIDNE